MIKVTAITKTESANKYKVSLFADTKSEVTSSAEIVGLPENAEIEMGSTILTASAEVGFMKSDGSWSWV